jgi:2-keto-4-pentenoate hydratase
MTPVSHTLDRDANRVPKGVQVLDDGGVRADDAEANAIARRLVGARASGNPLGAFPGRVPADLAAAYAAQEAGIALWPDTIAGWKVGLVGRDLVATFKQDRLAGPIFRRSVRRYVPDRETRFPVFVGGFAAVEAEFLLLLARDAPARKVEWTRAEARDFVEAVHVGVETAGSPLASINALGPCAIVSDFGNNAGLIVGPALPRWRSRPVEDWRVESFVDGVSVGTGHGGVAPGGPFESLRFLLELNARRGRPLRAGDWVSTGALTGIHEVVPGQTARISFADTADIVCTAEPFRAAADGATAW